MKIEAAVLWNVSDDWSVEEIDLDGPKEGEVLVRWVAAGLCHSDEHARTGTEVAAVDPGEGGEEAV